MFDRLKEIVFVLLLYPLVSLFGQNDYHLAREQMVKTQLKARDITDVPTLKAMGHVPRERFVPNNLRSQAYMDGPLPIGDGQTISQPYIVAYMTQSLQLKAEHRVLEIGTGSGYQAAILAQIVDSVYTVEIIDTLGLKAQRTLKALGYGNVRVRIGDGYHGWPKAAPFDAIIVTAGAEEIPPALVEQLADGGRMIIPVGPHHGVRQLVLLTNRRGTIRRKNVMAVRFVPFTRKEE